MTTALAFEAYSAAHIRTLDLTPVQFDIIATLGNTVGIPPNERIFPAHLAHLQQAFVELHPDELLAAEGNLRRPKEIFVAARTLLRKAP